MSLGEAEEEVADRVITGKALQPQQRVQNAIRPQPLAVGEALRPGNDRHQKGRKRMRQRDGVVGSRFGKGQMLLHLPGQADLAQEGNETGQTAEGRNRLGRLVQNQLGIAKERGNFGAGRFVQGRVGLFKHQSLCPQPLPQSDPFSLYRKSG